MENTFYKVQLDNKTKENEELIEIIESKDSLLYTVKLQRTLFIVTTIFFMIVIILFYFLKHKKLQNTIVSQNAVIAKKELAKDSLSIYKNGYFKSMEQMYPPAKEEESLNDIDVVYGVQIGAFKDFDLVSKELAHLHKDTIYQYNKFCIGNYKTYKEATMLKSKLIKLGFKGAFLSAKSYGESIDIRKALVISKEEKYLK